MSTGKNVATEVFERQRGRLQNIAYGMLGSIMEAEDVVQDVYLRWADSDTSKIDSPAAWLTTVATRVAIDRLRSAQKRRETYVGPWLPEPLISGFADDPAHLVEEAESLSLALLVALERLTPIERAVLLLREVFDMDYTEIADVVDKSPSNCRQIASRARQRAGDPTRIRQHDSAAEAQLLAGYVAALTAGDIDQLAAVFADDVVLWTDGGGRVRAARHPLYGAQRVARHLIGVRSQIPPDVTVDVVRANGDPALLATVAGEPLGIIVFEVTDDAIVGIRAQLNPDKLHHILASDKD